MAAVGPDSAAAGGAGASGERGVSASGAGKVDGGLRSAQNRFAEPVAGCFARTAHRDQTISLYGGKFSASAACVVGLRSEGAAGFAGRGARSGCAVGFGGRGTGVSRCGEPQALAREVELGARQEDRALSREDGGAAVAMARVAGGVAIGSASAGGGYEPASGMGGISGSGLFAFAARGATGAAFV